MADKRNVLDTVTLRFTGDEDSEAGLHELRAADVAGVLLGLTGIVSDFDKAGAFHDEGPANSEVLVRPAQEGSFVIEAIRVAAEYPEAVAAVAGVPSVASIVKWATKSARAEVENFDHLENGNVKVYWQDNTAEEIPRAAWEELNKRKRRRKKQLREIMAPLADDNVSGLEVSAPSLPDQAVSETPEQFTLTRDDFERVAPTDEVEEDSKIFEVDAQMRAIDFGDSTQWKVRADGQTRRAVVEDGDFLKRIAGGLAISSSDLFRMRIRADKVAKNGRERTTWTVLKVEGHRRAVGDEHD